MKFLIFTRFSVSISPTPQYLYVKNLAKKHGLDFSKKNESKLRKVYLDSLYAEDRMEFKFRGFTHLTLPSIVENLSSRANSKWCIYYSSNDCPQKYIDRLNRLTAPYEQIETVGLENGLKGETEHWLSEVEALKASGTRYCTVRCDDDDAISPHLLQHIFLESQQHESPFIYHCPNGKYCQVDSDGDIVIGSNVPKYGFLVTQGLAGVDLDIRGLGNHVKIKERYPHIPVIENENLKFLMNCDEKFTASRKSFR